MAFREDKWRSLIRPGLAELVASFFLITLAVGGASTTSRFSDDIGLQQLSISLSFGFTVMTLAFTVGHISGGHFNMVVTMSFLLVRKISWKRALVYVTAQTVGMILAGVFVKYSTPAWQTCYGANMVHSDVSSWQAVMIEFMLTFYLLLVINAASDSSKFNQTLVPMAIGFAVFGCHMFGIAIDGTSINPTRSLASAIASIGEEGCDQAWTDLWIFFVGPLAGGIAATFFYEYVFLTKSASGANTLEAMYRATTKTPAGYRSRFNTSERAARELAEVGEQGEGEGDGEGESDASLMANTSSPYRPLTGTDEM